MDSIEKDKEDCRSMDVIEKNGETAQRLLSWYDENKRDLPWRRDPTPYHVWLSEIMLQQTRVQAVLGYYARFLSAMPDIAALASAPQEQYQKLWEGLGYYSRVNNLHRAAVKIMKEYGGEMPGRAEELAHLPGIGPYTSAAIASIAFGEAVPAVDGNLLRVFARMSSYGDNIREPAALKAAKAWFQERIPQDRPGDFNQALMDLGSLVCVPKEMPKCGECPLSALCQAHLEGREMELPVMPAKKKRRMEERTVFLIRCRNEIALQQRPARGLLAGLYEFPCAQGKLTRDEAVAFVRSLGFSPVRIRELPGAKHIFTHIEWQMTGYEVLVDDAVMPASVFLTDRADLEGRYAVPSAYHVYKEIALADL